MIDCILHLGSNLGNPLHNLEVAEYLISGRIGLIYLKSKTYKTAPWGKEDQNDFLNKALCVSTSLEPLELLGQVNLIEQKMGRIREEKWGPRIIDIDIIFYGSEIIKIDDLIIPHPRLSNRNFVLVPLTDICAEFIHPESGKSIAEHCRLSTDKSKVEPLEI